MKNMKRLNEQTSRHSYIKIKRTWHNIVPVRDVHAEVPFEYDEAAHPPFGKY